MEASSLTLRIAQPEIVARDLLQAHHETYRTFWRWSNAAVDHAMLRGSLHTVFRMLSCNRTYDRSLCTGPRRGVDLRPLRSP